ncbi:GTP 3',8-cyclase MoaA [Anaeromyxobacter oryzae]|uniref:GTP 3',8-cyclase n=1 Tax=Anaeromyxobacter oryzae TaxID=2918170 RepID=A0ABM7X1E5_9BACT|nr:GTP 3',8-cyclase MoaA [Anaeromyxobacter oryzae]BDG05563.1 GTP 3',8-cyclase [Anaeromyxobacter oryzae]
MLQLQDAFGRQLQYLRLSVTDRCNFRCAYCLPDGCPRGAGDEPLSVVEIERLVRAFAALGVWKVRLTGGEPTMRRDIPEIVRAVAGTPGVRRVGLTTNGYRLAGLATELRDAGLVSVNVSLDSLDPARFEEITGCSRLERIVAGVEAALSAGIPSVKVNVVLLRGMDDAELDRFLAWTRERPLAVRFIELMQTGENATFFREHHVRADEIRAGLERRGWSRLARDRNDGPAITYGHPAHAGKAGLIAPYTPGFCDACNRVRVSSTGDLKLCLFGERKIPLRPYLRSDALVRELMDVIRTGIAEKPASHLLDEGAPGGTPTLASIGG